MRTLYSRTAPLILLAVVLLFIPPPFSPREPVPQSVLYPGAPAAAGVQGDPVPVFSDVTAAAGIAPTRLGQDRMTGQAWGDFDQDGWQDLYLTDPGGPNTLYHNRGDGTFEAVPAGIIDPLAQQMSSGAVFGDYDNDGYPDLYVLNRNQPNVLFHNERGERFVDVAVPAGVANPYDGKTASWGDFDGDGYLDLYVANWSCYPDCSRSSDGDADALYHNNGDGTFTDFVRALGSKVIGGGFIASFTDYDNDGDPDIYLVNDVFINDRGNALWRNDGPGCDAWCFSEVSAEAGADTRLMGMGLATADFDNDGDIDFYFSNAGPMVLLNNLGNGRFVDVAAAAGVDVGKNGVAWGSVALDYDSDGYQDLYLALTDMLPDGEPRNPLFRNLGDGSFENVSGKSGVGHSGRTLGVAAADYDRDGWVDLVIGDYERGYTLFHNNMSGQTGSGNLSVRLRGGQGVNRDAVGARVYLATRDGNTQMKEVQSGSGLGGGNSLVLQFGLGEAGVADLEVRWPDGRVESYRALRPGREYTFQYSQETKTGDAPLPDWALPALLALVVLALSAGSAGPRFTRQLHHS